MKKKYISILRDNFQDSRVNETNQYISLQVKNSKNKYQNFIELHFNKTNVRITIRKNSLTKEDLEIFKEVPEQHGWVLNAETIIETENDLIKLIPLIKKSYLEVKAHSIEMDITDLEDLKIGDKINNQLLSELFSVAPQGGMRKSNKRNHLVLITDSTKDIYRDLWNGNLLYYSGMGQKGDQDINYAQNKTLASSNETNIPIYLFEVLTKKEYTYRGIAKLVDKPFMDNHLDVEGNDRKVCIFPLEIQNGFLEENEILETLKNSKRRVRNKKNQEIESKSEKLKNRKLSRRKVSSYYYERDQDIVEYAKRRANGVCELCQKTLDFLDSEGRPFLETHHIKWLSEGGEDTIENTVAICPNCHKKMHIEKNKDDINKLIKINKKIVK
ncbi:HNH endonuclease [Vagococcus fluvialis]|uniref:HNH endonuclease n=1 Tax=Vagococcus fluvialis TaxID=2738 RepID=UPI0037A9D49F